MGPGDRRWHVGHVGKRNGDATGRSPAQTAHCAAFGANILARNIVPSSQDIQKRRPPRCSSSTLPLMFDIKIMYLCERGWGRLFCKFAGHRHSARDMTCTDAHSHPEDVLHRLRRLEDAVFNKADHLTTFTPFSCQVEESSSDENALTTKYIARVATKLPPINEARHLFDHFATVVQPNWGVIHVPSSRELLERTYEALSKDEEPQIANILFLFSIFAGAAFSWTPVLLRKIDSTRDKALIAAQAYSRTAQAISENAYQPVPPSTMALVAISCLAHISTHFRGLSDTEIVLRMKTLVMCRSMGIDRLDSTKSQEERRVKGCDMIEIEVQRRVWWNLVGFDWYGISASSIASSRAD